VGCYRTPQVKVKFLGHIMHKIQEEILLDPEGPLIQGRFSESGDVTINNYRDYYILMCAKALSSLDSCIDKSKLSLSLLNHADINKISKDDKQKSELIQLWVENSIIRVQSCYERLLILVNRIFDLGLANESISHNTLVCNDHIKRYGVDVFLRKINKSCQEYRFIRNTVIHHDRYTEEKLDQLTIILAGNYLSIEAGRGEIVKSDVIEQLVSEFLSVKQETLTEYITNIENEIHSLYDTLLKIYHIKKKELGAKI